MVDDSLSASMMAKAKNNNAPRTSFSTPTHADANDVCSLSLSDLLQSIEILLNRIGSLGQRLHISTMFEQRSMLARRHLVLPMQMCPRLRWNHLRIRCSRLPNPTTMRSSSRYPMPIVPCQRCPLVHLHSPKRTRLRIQRSTSPTKPMPRTRWCSTTTHH